MHERQAKPLLPVHRRPSRKNRRKYEAPETMKVIKMTLANDSLENTTLVILTSIRKVSYRVKPPVTPASGGCIGALLHVQPRGLSGGGKSHHRPLPGDLCKRFSFCRNSGPGGSLAGITTKGGHGPEALGEGLPRQLVGENSSYWQQS